MRNRGRRSSLPKSGIVVWAFGVGTELQHPARHVNCAFDLAAGSQLRRVTNVDNDNIALAHPVSEIGGLNPRHGGEPDKNSPLGYCEIGHWKLNVRGELVLRNEDGALLRECRLEGNQDPAAMAAKLLRAWWMADRKSDFGRVLRYQPDDWMA